MEQKKNADYQTQCELVKQENAFFLDDLETFNLQEKEPEYDIVRYLDILKIIRMMSRNKRSVDQVKHMLSVIFVISDADQLKDQNDRQLDCIVQKFKLCNDLAKTLKISIQDLLKNSSSEICGKITYLLLLNGNVISVIDYFIKVEFFLNVILPRSWYYLIS